MFPIGASGKVERFRVVKRQPVLFRALRSNAESLLNGPRDDFA